MGVELVTLGPVAKPSGHTNSYKQPDTWIEKIPYIHHKYTYNKALIGQSVKSMPVGMLNPKM